MCTLYELAVGSILLVGADNNDMLYQMIQLRGRFPNKLLKSAQYASKHFSDDLLQFKKIAKGVKGLAGTITLTAIPPKPTRNIFDLLMTKLPDVDSELFLFRACVQNASFVF